MRTLIIFALFLLCCGSKQDHSGDFREITIDKIGVRINYPMNWFADTASNNLTINGQVLMNWLTLQNWKASGGSPYLETGQLSITVLSCETSLGLSEWFDKYEKMSLKNIDDLIRTRNEDIEKQQTRNDFIIVENKVVLDSDKEAKVLFVKDPGGIEGGPVTLKNYYFKHRGFLITIEGVTVTSDSSDVLINQFDSIVSRTGFF
jgi:hypothetical protein